MSSGIDGCFFLEVDKRESPYFLFDSRPMHSSPVFLPLEALPPSFPCVHSNLYNPSYTHQSTLVNIPQPLPYNLSEPFYNGSLVSFTLPTLPCSFHSAPQSTFFWPPTIFPGTPFHPFSFFKNPGIPSNCVFFLPTLDWSRLMKNLFV